ncbi:MAG TPA: hypothetical protein VNA20_18565 [Frankiaceae bacterium]|nr:hypothetical protein [Frankiaceae bacterium]
MLRRRRATSAELVPVHEAFLRCAEHVDLAQRAMLRCVPSSARSLAIPLSVGAETLRLALADARAAMGGWRHPAVEEAWLACGAAIDETLALLDAAVARAAATNELEVALTAVQDLLDPLHAFVDAEEAFRRAR